MAKKSVTGWKQKKVYEIVAPDYFDSKPIGETIAEDPSKLKGRTVRASLKDITGDRTKQFLNLVFEVSNVAGSKAHTRFKSFSLSTAYLKSKIRKGMKKVDYIGDVALTDRKIRIKIMIAAGKSTTVSNQIELYQIIKKVLDEHKADNLDKFVQAVVFGKIGTSIYHKAKKVTSISRVEIQEVRVLGS
jgi:small subunit ribosomal protein S3Ae